MVLAAGAGCLATATATQLTSRASFDLSCSSGALRYKRIDDRTQGVLGCGKRAIYVENCDGPRGSMTTDCTWVLNGAIELEPAAPGAPGAALGATATPAPAAPPAQ